MPTLQGEPKSKVQDEEVVSTRLNWPRRIHTKILKHQSSLSIKLGRRITFEEASIDYIDRTKAPE